MSAPDTFQLQLLHESGFTTPERIALRRAVLRTLSESASNAVHEMAWSLQDALPRDCDYDWSGIRDSSYAAIAAMAVELGIREDSPAPDHRTYKVQRVYFNRPGRKTTLKTGLTLAEAQAHCSDPETSSSTCTRAANVRRTRRVGRWFDCYTEEK